MLIELFFIEWTPLIIASRFPFNFPILEVLVNGGANVSASDRDGK